MEDVGHGLAHGRLGRLLTGIKAGIERAADHARVGRLGVAQLPGLVHLLAGQAQVGDGRFNVPLRNVEMPGAPVPCDLAPLLRGIVLIREPALGLGLDLKSVGPLAIPAIHSLYAQR